MSFFLNQSVKFSLIGTNFPFLDGSDWPSEQTQTPVQMPKQQSQPSKRLLWKGGQEKKPPITEYNSWSQRKKSPYEAAAMEQMQRDSFSIPSSNCFCSSQGMPGLITTTAQTDGQGGQGCPCMMHQQPSFKQPTQQPVGMGYHDQQFGQMLSGQSQSEGDQWQMGSPLMSQFNRRKFSLPPASHHSPEQRTSYREQRFC